MLSRRWQFSVQPGELRGTCSMSLNPLVMGIVSTKVSQPTALSRVLL